MRRTSGLSPSRIRRQGRRHRRNRLVVDFVAHELHLYLDTHSEDKEAFEILQRALKLAREAHERYVKLYGPIKACDLEKAKSFTWLKNPWPWDYCGNKED